MELSIIVPVYNTRDFLPKCIGSLIDQDISHEKYEIILINDESTDDCLDIINSFKEKYEILRLFSQENTGPGGARNFGIKNAKGKYLLFIDSDDFIESNCLGKLLLYAEEFNLDVLRFNLREIDKYHKAIQQTKIINNRLSSNKCVTNGEYYLTEIMGYTCYAVAHMYRTSFILENELFFKGKLFYEDTEWLPRVLLKAKRVSYLNEIIYNYVRRLGSITLSLETEKKEKLIDNRWYIIDQLLLSINQQSNPNIRLWMRGSISLKTIAILKYTQDNFPNNINQTIKKIYDRGLIPLKSNKMTIKQKFIVFLININPSLFLFSVKVFRKCFRKKLEHD